MSPPAAVPASIDAEDTVLVTGGLGFIGSTLVRRLVRAGVDVRVADAGLEAYGANSFNLEGVREGVSIHDVDVRDEDAVSELVYEADHVFHLAAQLSRTVAQERPHTDLRINAEGTLNVLEAAVRAADSPSVIYTSSQAVYGSPASLPLTEETPTAPIDLYGCTKLAGEHYADVYRSVHDLDVTVLRLTNVYGPRAQLHNPHYGVVNRFLQLALRDEPLTVFGSGTTRRSFVHVDDVVRALLVAAGETPRDTYLVGDETSITIRELAERIVETAGTGRVEFVDWPDDWDGIRVGDVTVDTSRLRGDTDWTLGVEFEDGLESTVDYYETHLEEYVEP